MENNKNGVNNNTSQKINSTQKSESELNSEKRAKELNEKLDTLIKLSKWTLFMICVFIAIFVTMFCLAS